MICGAEGNRTPDLVIANDALSQLSYSPIGGNLTSKGLGVKNGPNISKKQSFFVGF